MPEVSGGIKEEARSNERQESLMQVFNITGRILNRGNPKNSLIKEEIKAGSLEEAIKIYKQLHVTIEIVSAN